MAYRQSPINFGIGTGSSPLKSNRGSEGMMDARDLVESNAPPSDDTNDVAFEAEESSDEAVEAAEAVSAKKKRKRRRKWGKGLLMGGIGKIFGNND